jgi:hypothetical protein
MQVLEDRFAISTGGLMTTPLSPAAQAVMDAYHRKALNSREWANGDGPRLKVAAAVKELVDQLLPETVTPWNSVITISISAAEMRMKMLSVVKELGNQ